MTTPHITHLSPRGLQWLADLEGGFRLTAYRDQAGVWTIGAGTTRYPEGHRVAAGDTCTEQQARWYYAENLKHYELAVDAATHDELLQHEFDALVSFAYNVGEVGYRTSTLARLINARRPEPEIRAQFCRWIHVRDEITNRMRPDLGLAARRICDADVFAGVGYPTQGDPSVRARAARVLQEAL